VTLNRSRPFRMRKPEHQAAFYRTLTTILYYLVSGDSKVGYITMEDWNPYFQRLRGLHVMTLVFPITIVVNTRPLFDYLWFGIQD